MQNDEIKRRTAWVIIVTIITMIIEVGAGMLTASMALLADGLHMGTHALALSITFIICLFVDKYKDKEDRLNALGGYTSAIFLGATAVAIIIEAIRRVISPEQILFNQAIIVTFIGLIVNIVCVLIMGGVKNHHHHQNHSHNHKENVNFKAAYLHILADALTSVLALVALMAGKYFGLSCFDPLVGLLGGIIIFKWAMQLIASSVKQLIN